LANRAAFEIGKRPDLKVWLRSGKWEGIRANSTQNIERGTAFSRAAVDRSFYRSSNLITLQASTPKSCTEEKPPPSMQCVDHGLAC
jgi:hypothetical protein